MQRNQPDFSSMGTYSSNFADRNYTGLLWTSPTTLTSPPTPPFAQLLTEAYSSTWLPERIKMQPAMHLDMLKLDSPQFGPFEILSRRQNGSCDNVISTNLNYDKPAHPAVYVGMPIPDTESTSAPEMDNNWLHLQAKRNLPSGTEQISGGNEGDFCGNLLSTLDMGCRGDSGATFLEVNSLDPLDGNQEDFWGTELRARDKGKNGVERGYTMPLFGSVDDHTIFTYQAASSCGYNFYDYHTSCANHPIWQQLDRQVNTSSGCWNSEHGLSRERSHFDASWGWCGEQYFDTVLLAPEEEYLADNAPAKPSNDIVRMEKSSKPDDDMKVGVSRGSENELTLVIEKRGSGSSTCST